MSHDLVQQASKTPVDGAGGPGGSPARRVFLNHTHAGRFVVAGVEQVPARHESHVPGLFIVPYRVTLEAQEVLPPITAKRFVLAGSRGEGPEAGALGLEDWLPTTAGAELVLLFDPLQLESGGADNAKQVEYLAAGAAVGPVWESVKRFHESLSSEPGLNPNRIAAAIGREPLPRSTFFQLVFAYDRNAYQNPAVVRAFGAYLANDRVPALDRRTTVAHYAGQPGDRDAQALSTLAEGLLRLAVQLSAEGQAASADVVLQRVYGFLFDPGTGVAKIPPPALSDAQRTGVIQLLSSPDVNVNAAIKQGLGSWIQP